LVEFLKASSKYDLLEISREFNEARDQVASVKASVNATSLKSNFVGNFVRARNCIKRTRMKSNPKYKMFVSESSIYPQNFMSIGVPLDTKK
jgi:hypothetical protein